MSTPSPNSGSHFRARRLSRREHAPAVRWGCWFLSAWFLCVSVGVPTMQANCCGMSASNAAGGSRASCCCLLSAQRAGACCCRSAMAKTDASTQLVRTRLGVESATCGVVKSCCAKSSSRAASTAGMKPKAACCSKELRAPSRGSSTPLRSLPLASSPLKSLPLASLPRSGEGRAIVEIDQCGCGQDALPGLLQHREPRSLTSTTVPFQCQALSFSMLPCDDPCPLIFRAPPVPPPRLTRVLDFSRIG